MFLGALVRVFRRPVYTLLALAIAAVTLLLTILLPNAALIEALLREPRATVGEMLAIIVGLLGSIATNMSTAGAVALALIAVLLGVNVAMLAYFLGHRIAAVRQSGIATGLFGIIIGLLGVGCAACGSLLLFGGLSVIGAAGILTLLPFGGEELAFAGAALLLLSAYLTARHIENPLVCRVEP